jgi:hypothetical protein
VAAIGFDIKVADEVWIATALLHRKYPDCEDFTIDEIVERAKEEAIGGKHRPGVYVHVLQHCVANRPPNPGRYCMLLETCKGRLRLWRPLRSNKLETGRRQNDSSPGRHSSALITL